MKHETVLQYTFVLTCTGYYSIGLFSCLLLFYIMNCCYQFKIVTGNNNHPCQFTHKLKLPQLIVIHSIYKNQKMIIR